MTKVVRVGDTVRRTVGPWTPGVHALLYHLERKGFNGSPRVLGIDQHGREILSYISGTAASRPWPRSLCEDTGIEAFAHLLRQYHRAVADFIPPNDTVWRTGNTRRSSDQIIRHGDLGPWNSIWREGVPVAFIDWDFAEPGDAIDDVAQACWYAIPLRGDDGAREAGFDPLPDYRSRLTVFCRAYGGVEPDEVLHALVGIQIADRSRLIDLGGRGHEPWASFLKRGDLEQLDSEIRWLAQHGGG